MPSQFFKADYFSDVDIQKIKDMLDQNAVNIFVGFPSGRQHIETRHKNEHDQVVDYNGDDSPIEPMETADLAEQLHYGTATIPARPFLDEAVEKNKVKIEKAIQAEIEKSENGQKPNWNKIGAMVVGMVQEFVRSDYYKENVPNSQKTIDYKGSDKPLIDGGDLINSLTFQVMGGTK